jgi:hypothetical protein
MELALSYPRPWHEVAVNLRTTDFDGFARYRDSFYHFAVLAGLSAEWAAVAFSDADAVEAAREFVKANLDLQSFLQYLHDHGASETGLSGSLEDNLAGPSLDSWGLLLKRSGKWAG